MGALCKLESLRLAASRLEAEPIASPSAEALRVAVASAAARDWLETQARVVEYWRDLLADVGEAGDLVEALDVHAAFLNGMVARS